MKIYAIIPSGGIGKRINSSLPKQYIQINGKELIAYTLEIFQNCEEIDEIIIPAQKEFFTLLSDIREKYNLSKISKILEGGSERQFSVYNAFQSISSKDDDLILVHDSARPLLPQKILESALKAAKTYYSVIVAMKTKDTLISGNEYVEEYIDRSKIYQVQTPQIFKSEMLQKAMNLANNQSFIGSDESILIHRASNGIKIVEGSSINFKVTTDSDLDLFRLITNIKGL